jgi:hypothetical protein
MDFKWEYIVCSAVWFKNLPSMVHLPKNISEWRVYTWLRHCNCFEQANTILDNVWEVIQWFLTSKNKFVDREEACVIAWSSWQTENVQTQLFSEDLY